MTNHRFIDLIVLAGPDKGMHYTIEQGSYRLFARSLDSTTSTAALTTSGDRAIEREQQPLVDQVSAAAEGSANRLSSSLRRGPDMILRDTACSRLHAMVVFGRQSLRIADLMSTNGTRCGGQLIQDSPLQRGDIIQIGQTRILVENG